MHKAIGGLVIAGLVVLVLILEKTTNRDLRRRLSAAERLVKERLKGREELPRDCLLKGLTSEDQKRYMWTVMEGIAALLEVEPGKLRPDESLDDILTVQENDQTTMVLAYEAADLIENQLDRKQWTRVQQELTPAPDSEDAWIEVLFKLPLEDLASLMARNL